jgi:hypothetical protein
MNKRSLGILVALNLLLLIGLAVVSLTSQPAAAQFGMRGDYAMIAGKATGRDELAAVYVLELKSQKMIALMFDSRNKKLETIAGRVVSHDMRAMDSR